MTILLLGVAVFFGVHLVPSFPAVRSRIIDKIGATPYKGIYSLLALAGLVLIGFGYSGADFTLLWDPPLWARNLALLVMPLSVILLVAADRPGHIRRIVRHPMSFGVVLWSGVHLLANGDLASTVIFGFFGFFAVFSAISMQIRGKSRDDSRAAIKHDGIAVVIGFSVYALIVFAHEYLIGVPVLVEPFFN